MRLIDADALYERACNLEAQALDYVGKLIERDGDKVSVEWKIWSAILTERTAFKHDVFDAPTIDAVEKKVDVVRCKDCKKVEVVRCKHCRRWLNGDDTYGTCQWNQYQTRQTKYDDFCSYGERK